MHLGLTPWDFKDASAAGLTAQAQFAEACGYESFWLPENHFNRGAIPDPLMLLAAVAGGTSRIRLATTSYLLPLRHPLQAAEQVAVLDQLSGGRVILGVGRGFAPDMLKAFSVRPKEKRALFEVCLATMMLAWSGEPVEIDEQTGASVVLDPLPVQ
ncbi:MAG: LLM class flavin-dependent oxidoreductase, partial [Proteobacteria bacterium]|nr:LLM class flavin-dependent oxidoreductase [Pseudomonadota bacterium]